MWFNWLFSERFRIFHINWKKKTKLKTTTTGTCVFFLGNFLQNYHTIIILFNFCVIKQYLLHTLFICNCRKIHHSSNLYYDCLALLDGCGVWCSKMGSLLVHTFSSENLISIYIVMNILPLFRSSGPLFIFFYAAAVCGWLSLRLYSAISFINFFKYTFNNNRSFDLYGCCWWAVGAIRVIYCDINFYDCWLLLLLETIRKYFL